MSKTDQLKKIVGSLLVLGFPSTKVSDSLKNFLQQWELGGVILFKRNISSPEQVAALNQEIYQLAQKVPIVSVDHEGGKVFRLPEPFTVFPPMRALGNFCAAAGNTDLARKVGQVFARELRAVGFNVDYAPVLDVDSYAQNPIIGERAFATEAEKVSAVALAFLQGLEKNGVIGCGKHFPGHGHTSQDSHLTLPVVDKSFAELAALELLPFRAAIGSGISLLMTAHVLYPQVDPDWPATLSEKFLRQILRQQLGYSGLIISDDFFMQGITERWDIEAAAERFLRVGGDLVLLCHEEAKQRRVAAHLIHQAEKDMEFSRIIEEKSNKINKFRAKLNPLLNTSGLAVLGCAEHLEINQLLRT